jgi:hypothetical protein
MLDHPCLIWAGAKNDKGYGYVRIAGKVSRVHRLVASIAYGPISKGDVVMHRCDNPSCYRVEHLAVGSQKDNIRDMILKGRSGFVGERNQHAKLTKEDVIYIRGSSMSGRKLASVYGVSEACISEARSGKKWKWLTP